MSSITESPFAFDYKDESDLELIARIQEGDRVALDALIRRHQNYVYNVALKMLLSPADAEDLTQEVFIKVITKLSQFQGKSNFRTWLYRIVFNHFLNIKRSKMEQLIESFEAYGDDLDQVADHQLSVEEQVSLSSLVTEAKIACMSGMLLCLNREQRLVYILGEIFSIDHRLGAELLAISSANFRKKLERARRDLYSFMQNKCGLINRENPCRCARKTKGFIAAGWVDPNHIKFNTDYRLSIESVVAEKDAQLNRLLTSEYQALFQQLPFQEKDTAAVLQKTLSVDGPLHDLFDL